MLCSSGGLLVDRIDRVLIIAYRESTEILETTLQAEGFCCEVVRQEDRPEYSDYASIYRCMLNHQRAWQQAALAEKPTLIIEADFVPVLGMGQLPLPFDPQQESVGIAWLYTCAPQIYSVAIEGYVEGFSTGLVAYIVTPTGAAALDGLVEEITTQHGTGYYNFDSKIDEFLRRQGFKNYIPYRNYGEHGGKSNPEHRHNGMSGIHRADVLYGKLAFMPPYAAVEQSPRLALWKARSQARVRGLGRLLTGRFLRMAIVRKSSFPGRLLRFAILRQLSLHL
jgi:hypothetical protein